MSNCLFCKIANKEIVKTFTYEDEDVMVFPDIHPLKPVHLLVVPKKHIQEFSELSNDSLLIKMKNILQNMIKEKDLSDAGYRIVINGGGAQAIDHLHIHLTGPWGKAADL